MSKAMLIIEMPAFCTQCPCYEAEWRECQVKGYIISEENRKHGRPFWCPLRPYNCEIDHEIAASGLTDMVKEWDRGEG